MSFLVTVANRAKEDREGFVLMTVVNRVRGKPGVFLVLLNDGGKPR